MKPNGKRLCEGAEKEAELSTFTNISKSNFLKLNYKKM